MRRLLIAAVMLSLIGCADSTAPTDLPDFLAKKGGKPARVNYALDFTTNYVQVPDNDLLDLTTSYTLEAWIKPHSVAISFQHIISKWNGGGDASYTLEIHGGRLRSAAHNGVANSVIESNSLLSNDVWQHVAVTFDNGMLRLYINGALDNSIVDAVTPMNSTRPVSFGREGPPANVWHYDGQIDEVRVWNVTRSERQLRRSMGKRLRGREKGLVGYWRFDEGEGATAFDATKNNLDGTLGGATWTTDAAPLKGY
jgi:hypothetical protein